MMREQMKEVLMRMEGEDVHSTGLYDLWIDELLLAMRDAAEEYAGEADDALDDHRKQGYMARDYASITAWKAIIDMAVWGSWK